MDKISIYVKDIDEALEVKNWLRENVGSENYQQWISFGVALEDITPGDWDPRGMRRTFSFKNPEHETLFVLKWAR